MPTEAGIQLPSPRVAKIRFVDLDCPPLRGSQ